MAQFLAQKTECKKKLIQFKQFLIDIVEVRYNFYRILHNSLLSDLVGFVIGTCCYYVLTG